MQQAVDGEWVASLPMYDWPEVQVETDAEWRRLRDALRHAGIAAPDRVVRRNADLPAVPGGIRDVNGAVMAPDPATLAPDELDLQALWRHPRLLLAQTCWGPMGEGLADHVQLVGQPSYDEFEGGQGEFYSSVILMRDDEGDARQDEDRGNVERDPVKSPPDGRALLPLDLFRGARLAFNSTDSMSGIIALGQDLEAIGESLDIFTARFETAGHRASIRAVAEGRADVCAADCRSWAMAQRFEPAAGRVRAVGWTARRKGLPYICAGSMQPETVTRIRAGLAVGR